MKRGLQKKTLLVVMLLSGFLVGLLTGCGARNKASYDHAVMASSSASYAPKEEMDMGYAGSLGTGSGTMSNLEVQSNQKLIKTVDMNVETKAYDDMLSALSQQIESCGGYVENMNSYNGSIYSNYRSSRNAELVIRIPADHLEGFLDEVSQMSNVVRRNDNVENVTLEYVDLESHKEALQVEQERLLELLKTAKNLEDIIRIEERLSTVRYQLESMESQLRTYDNQINYSTVNLYIEEVQELTPVVKQTVGERIAEGFMDSLNSIGDGFVELVIWIIVNSPILLVWAVIIVVAFLIIRRWYGKRKVIKEARFAQGVNPEDAVIPESFTDLREKKEPKA